MKLVLAYLYGMLLGFLKSIPTALFNIASEAVVAVLLWVVWNCIGPKLEYYQVFGAFYMVGVVFRSFTNHLKPIQPPMVFRFETFNGHQYMYSANLETFRRDASLHAAILESARKGKKNVVGG